jgi:CHAD domain-containing protein
VRPIGELAAERIRHAYRQVRKEGDAITPSSPPEALHALRIKCKRLRYLLEFFSPLFGEKKTGRLVTPLKVLQDNLGDFNDLTLQQARLTDFAHDMVREQQVGADSLLAMGRLVEHLAARQAGERGRFEKSYAAFSRPRIRRRLRRLLRRKALKRE